MGYDIECRLWNFNIIMLGALVIANCINMLIGLSMTYKVSILVGIPSSIYILAPILRTIKDFILKLF